MPKKTKSLYHNIVFLDRPANFLAAVGEYLRNKDFTKLKKTKTYWHAGPPVKKKKWQWLRRQKKSLIELQMVRGFPGTTKLILSPSTTRPHVDRKRGDGVADGPLSTWCFFRSSATIRLAVPLLSNIP
jgi:hypothetical protein